MNRVVEELYTGPEALEWLRSNKNPSALASNRFGPTADATEFVQSLYDTGAEYVMISSSCIVDDSETLTDEGGPYADAIVVVIPHDRAKRKNLFDIIKKEIESEGFEFNPEDELYESKMFLWWD
ncbi:MAG: hypothetical protein KC994_12065 [Candidatus Omnitrophica bacterium]|nr:hypothetical protein [Candidatus Omnitrophota bacterium]